MRSVCVGLVTSALLLAACYPPPPKYPEVKDKHYLVRFDTSRSTLGGGVPRQSDVLASDTAALLAPGKTVAFLPPDSCATESVAPSGSTQSSTAIQMECGALLASLEAEVAKAGYSVVSWQTLKGTGAGASQERARARNVDVLFEVNQLSQSKRAPGARQLSNLSFFKSDAGERATPTTVTPSIAQRCVGMVPGLDRGTDEEYLATINLKAVDVASGRALWLYQNSVVEIVGEEGLAQQLLFFRAEGKRERSGPEAKTGMTTWGVFFLETALLVPTGALLHLVGSPGPTIGKVSIGIGLAFGIAGAILLAKGKDPYAGPIPEPTYPSPDEVICVGDPVHRSTNKREDAVEKTESSSSFSFNQQVSAASDPTRERSQRLAQKITLDFVGALKAVATQR